MNTDQLCHGCMQLAETQPCPHCGWRRGQTQEGPYLPAGTILKEQYLVGRVLGHGGFGITYLAWDLMLARKLAIKEYFPGEDATRSPGKSAVTVYESSSRQFDYGKEQFLEEGRVVARFYGHPGIVGMLNYFQEHGTAYLVMEYLDGFELEEYLRSKGGKIRFEEALLLLFPVMEALRGVHREGILHRDISPDNIMVLGQGPENQEPRERMVKLVDFGAARYALGKRSRNLSVILKEGYAPGEQYRAKGHQGPWTDVYATAATLYRALTGQIPPPALDREVSDELQPPSRLGFAIGIAAEAALLKGLAIDAASRFQSMEDFQEALSRGEAHSVPAPVPLPFWQKLIGSLRRRVAWSATQVEGWRAGTGPVGRLPGWWLKVGGVAVAVIVLALIFRPDVPDSDPKTDADKQSQTKDESSNDRKETAKNEQSETSTDVPLPAISSLQPISLVIGRPEKVIVQGQNFQQNSIVEWNQLLSLDTRFVDSTRLEATVSAEQLTGAGKVGISVWNPAGEGKGRRSGVADLLILDPSTVTIPTISRLDPVSFPSGSADAQLNVFGEYFQSGTVAEWNRQSVLETRYVSSNQLVVTIRSQVLQQPGKAVITVSTPIGGGRVNRSGGVDLPIVDRPPPVVEGYPQLLERARKALGQSDIDAAQSLSAQAIQSDPSKPEAYDVSAFVSLYHRGDIRQATQAYQAALARGGLATFLVRHDHGDLSFARSCTGFLQVSRQNVRFNSNGGHNFSVATSQIREAAKNRIDKFLPFLNNQAKSATESFHIKTSQANYNLAGTSGQRKAETDLILSLLPGKSRKTKK